MTVPDAAIGAAAAYVAHSVYGEEGPDAEDWQHGRELVLRVYPHLIAAERARLRTLIDPRKLELIAAHLDLADDRAKVPAAERQVQRDLRQWASILRGGEPGPATITDILIDGAEAVAPELATADGERM